MTPDGDTELLYYPAVEPDSVSYEAKLRVTARGSRLKMLNNTCYSSYLLLNLFFPPHSPPLNVTYFPDYVRNLDEVPSIQIDQCDFFGIGVTCNDPIHCSHRCFLYG